MSVRTADLQGDIAEVLLTEDQIQDKVEELGARITADYAGRSVTLVSVLKGSLPFMADLMRSIDLPLRIDLMEVSSYGGNTTESSGLVRILKDLSASIEGEDVLIVEDIIDTGLTLNYLIRYLRGKNPTHAAHLHAARQAGPPPRRRSPSTTSASRSPTSSSSATASTTARSIATFGSSACSGPRSTAPVRTRRRPSRRDHAPAAPRRGSDPRRDRRGGHPCRLPAAVVAASQPGGLPALQGNALEGSGIIVLLVGIATLLLVALPYAVGDRPTAIDRWEAYGFLAVVGWLGFGWRVLQLLQMGAFRFEEPLHLFTNGPGLWIAGIGLGILSRAAFRMSREPHYR